MKAIINYSAIFLLLLTSAISSCEKDFLERYPLDAMSDATFFSSPNDLKVYVNGIYPMFPRYHFQGSFDGASNIALDANSDILIGTGASGALLQKGSNGQAPLTNSTWTSSFSWIRSINYFLQNYQRVVPRTTETNQFSGEGYFFRAWVYYNMLLQFGDAPIITEVLNTNSPELYKPRDSRYDVAKFIIQDLDSAISNLGWKNTAFAGVGRVNKEAAIVMKARVALFEGTWERYHGRKNSVYKVSGKTGDDLLALVEPAVLELMARHGSLLFNAGGPYNEAYNQLFAQQDASKTPGVFLYRVYDATQIVGHNFFDNVVDAAFTASRRMVDAYLDKQGNPQSTSSLSLNKQDLTNLATNLDPRFRQTIWTPDRGPQNKLIGLEKQALPARYPLITNAFSSNFAAAGLRLWKGAILNANEWRNGSTDEVLIRYEEALLALAEAKAILGTITQADLDKTVNVIRNRVGMASMQLAAVNSWSITYERNKSFDPTESKILNEIRRERLVELAYEGHRVNDLKRWAVYEDVINGFKPQGAHHKEFVDYFNDVSRLMADGFTSSDAAKCKLTQGVNFDIDAEGYINPFFRVPEFKSGGEGYFIEAGRSYLSAVPRAEIDLYLEKGGVTLTQNPGWF
ncbi:MAG: RagB/SusD family nutrient uptake outer membrane protein [Cyclobacteriaceae bacterium]|nr:RagB/SusD family nutrient uptake outer membrane protein [Cyclobacteriaceae bacterium]